MEKLEVEVRMEKLEVEVKVEKLEVEKLEVEVDVKVEVDLYNMQQEWHMMILRMDVYLREMKRICSKRWR